MKAILFAILISAATVFAGPDTELTVGRRTLDKQPKISKPKKNRSELTRGLHITVKNTGTRPLGEGDVDWAVLVERPGSQQALLTTGKEKLKALQIGETASFDVGAVAVQETGATRQDMEYRVVVQRGGEQAALAESTPKFDQLAQAAHGGKKGKAAGKKK